MKYAPSTTAAVLRSKRPAAWFSVQVAPPSREPANHMSVVSCRSPRRSPRRSYHVTPTVPSAPTASDGKKARGGAPRVRAGRERRVDGDGRPPRQAAVVRRRHEQVAGAEVRMVPAREHQIGRARAARVGRYRRLVVEVARLLDGHGGRPA